MKKCVAYFLLFLAPFTSTDLGGQEPAHFESHHSIQMGSETVEYDAVVGSIILRDEEEGATA
jgi:hypothetical protein